MPTIHQLVQKGRKRAKKKNLESRVALKPSKTRGLHESLHFDTKEAELRPAQGGTCTAYQRYRSDGIYSGCRPQFAGTRNRFNPGWAREGFAGRTLSHCARDFGHDGGSKPQKGQVEIRS
jgi:hypothetical protein